jgi:phospholipid transport system transporter-binding protein
LSRDSSSADPAWALPARLTMAEAAAALAALRAAPAQGGALRVDASALAEFDSAALALLLQARREAGARGRGFELLGAPLGLRQLAGLYGVGELLGLGPA